MAGRRLNRERCTYDVVMIDVCVVSWLMIWSIDTPYQMAFLALGENDVFGPRPMALLPLFRPFYLDILNPRSAIHHYGMQLKHHNILRYHQT
jgi:hypothetical protein